MKGHIFLLFSILVFSSKTFSHAGGKDNNGGHFNRTTGEYHCHTDDCIDPDTTIEDEFDWVNNHSDSSTTIAGSWRQVKKWARDIIYEDKNLTFYCGCQYEPNSGSGGSIDKSTCSYDSTGGKHVSRADRLEWEHVVPASLMPARQFACWNTGLPNCHKPGRECCEKHDLNAKIQIFDLHNLVPRRRTS